MRSAASSACRRLPPTRPRLGPLGWAREHLFSSWTNAALTLVALYLLYLAVPPLVRFTLIDAVWTGTAREDCLTGQAGACWPFIRAKLGQFIYGRYPVEERWRVDLVLLAGLAGLIPMLVPRLPGKRLNAVFLLVVYPPAAFVLLTGGVVGLAVVETQLWGGLLVTLVVAVTGMVLSLPLGIVLALGRRSRLPLVRLASIAFIEFWRGVPLITVLFMASVMLPLFFPPGVTLDKLLRALIGVALFASAYMAEVVRGGLQAIPPSQFEAARAIGLGYWSMMRLVILPQALRVVIPGIVNTFIALFKETTLVLIIGLFDLLGAVQLALTDPAWAAPYVAHTGYLFAAAVFWAFCFAMSRYSVFMEERLKRGAVRAGPVSTGRAGSAPHSLQEPS